jgi:TctA family transporter
MVVNMSQAIQVTLLVMLSDGIPIPVTTQLLVPMLNMARLQPGAQLSVTIDPQIPASVRIDWSK